MSLAMNDNSIPVEDLADYSRLLEALVFASERPLTVAELQTFFPKDVDIHAMLTELQQTYENRGFNLVEIADKWSFRSATDLAPYLRKEKTVQRKLSRATVETLAIVAYHQPITRAEIEEIRGVSVAQGTLDILLQAGWVKPGKRRETPGRPTTWITTEEFLQHFGISAIEDLPGFDELKSSGLLDKNRPAALFPGADAESSALAEALAEDDIPEDMSEEL